MVIRCARSVKLQDSLKLYQRLNLDANVRASPVDNLKIRIE